jgi:hypothetical protein
MELIRQQAERAAQGEPYGVRELPPVATQIVRTKTAAAASTAAAAAPAAVEDAEVQAARLRRREEALARRRAREAQGQ